MKKWASMIIFLLFTLVSATAFASLTDTKATIANQYGDYRLVIDTDNQPWYRAEWEAKGVKRAQAAAYMYSFTRNNLHFQMEVQYDNTRPDAQVRAQRITPDMAIKVRELKSYLPEVYALITSPKAEIFATYKDTTLNFQEPKSPVTMGALVKIPIVGHTSSYTVVSFNIQDEGRLIKDPKFIDENTYIREITIERIMKSDAEDNLAAPGGDWSPVKSYF